MRVVIILTDVVCHCTPNDIVISLDVMVSQADFRICNQFEFLL